MDTFPGHTAVTLAGRRLRSPVVAIGNFDGVHRGHAHIFHEAKRIAAGLGGGAEAVVLTFDPHPAKVLAPSYAPPLITPLHRKLELIAREGIEVTVVEPFDRAFAQKSPETFVDEVLVAALGVRAVCVGHDFTFGAKRAGTVELLVELSRTRGFTVHEIPPYTVDGIMCSSTKVREFVLEGRVEGATLLLGRAPEVEGQVVRGDGRGQKIGVPTANLRAETELLPKNGVYAGFAELESGERAGAAINVGTNPTFTSDHPITVEAHLLDWQGDLYGRRLRVGFIERLRAEERYSSVDALVAQIRKDIEATRATWRAHDGKEIRHGSG
jgi:riboflavin kinase/FMN adenylyltransferase